MPLYLDDEVSAWNIIKFRCELRVKSRDIGACRSKSLHRTGKYKPSI